MKLPQRAVLLALALCCLLAAADCGAQEAKGAAEGAAAEPAAPVAAAKAAPAKGAAGKAGARRSKPDASIRWKTREERRAAHRAAAAKHAADKATKAEAAKEKAAAAKASAAAEPKPKATVQKGLQGKALEAAINKAIDAQKQHKPQEAILAQFIEDAQAVELANGDGDISTAGGCREEIDAFCSMVEPGERRLADCLRQQLAAEALPDWTGPHKWSKECKAELDHFLVDEATDINKNLPLAKACKKDVKRLCRDVAGSGLFISCLKGRPERLTQKCYDEVFKVEQASADDIRTDPLLYNACKADIQRKCKGVKPEGGRVQQCLRRRRTSLDWGCREELFRQAIENADDFRLSSVMFAVCFQDKKKFCADVAPGHARAIDCLELHRAEPDFSRNCSMILEATLAQRATDFRLDPEMARACDKDIRRTCGVEKDAVEAGRDQGEDAAVISCLQDFRDELRSEDCAARVRRGIERASQDIRFDARLGNACYEDRQNLCSSVAPGSARVIRCLQSKRAQLSAQCKAAMFDEETLMGESIDFQFPMKTACHNELDQWCGDIPHDHARAIRCLQDHLDAPGFGADCRTEVARHQQHLAEDYRLNFRLAEACDSSTRDLCSGVQCEEHATCGGAMLRCLTEKKEQITVPECLHEVEYFQKMEVTDFRNDIILAEACRGDVEAHCAKIQPGMGRVHKCLQEHLELLSDKCRKEETRLQVAAADSIALQPDLAADCAAERAEFCADVRPGASRIYNCLVASAEQVDFSERCHANLKRQQLTRLSDWQLDANLRTFCKNDAPSLCASTIGISKKHGEVLQCLVGHIGISSAECSRETLRAVHTALQFYQPGLPVINVCDADAEKFCIKDREAKHVDWAAGKGKGGLGKHGVLGREAADAPVGQVRRQQLASSCDQFRRCLDDHVPRVVANGGLDMMLEDVANSTLAAGGRRRLRQAQDSGVMPEGAPHGHADDAGSRTDPQPPAEPLSDRCASLVMLGDPNAWESFETQLAVGALAGQLARVQSSLKLPEDTLVFPRVSTDGERAEMALTLTGWSAVAGMFALVGLVLGAVMFSWKRYYDARYGGYEVVMKKPPRGERSVELQ